MTSDRITTRRRRYLPLPEGYVNYARIAIVLKNFTGSARSAHLGGPDPTFACQKIDIVSRKPT